MKQVLDLHIHSPYSRACSSKINLENIYSTCLQKGVDIIATSDFTHPAWFRAIKNELEETYHGSGLFKLKSKDERVKFILSTEVSLIYKDKDKVRRIHLMLHAPSIEVVEELNVYLDKHYNIRSDGRPILGIKAYDFVKLVLGIDKRFLIYPAHVWTPWFSVFGSKSGFNSLEECFEDQTNSIYAIETGLSSDPEMNWRLSALDKLTVLSSSDAHSLPNIAREATVMEISEPLSYEKIYQIIKHKSLEGDNKLLYTIEFYPEEGMYHVDGHRVCNFSCLPSQSKKLKNICPVCSKPLIIGVLHRLEELADRPEGFKAKNAVSFKKLIELDKIIKEVMGVKSRNSKKVQAEYQRIVKEFGSELNVLMDISLKTLERSLDQRMVEGIKRVRNQNLMIKPGYDGNYGEVKIFSS